LALRGVLLDTNAYSAFKRGRPEALEIVRRAPALCFNSVILGELLGGFVAGSREARNRRELEEFCSLGRVRRLVIDADTAEHYSAIYNQLRHQGMPIPTNDMWIAASALQHGLDLFSYDGHFKQVEGLSVGARLEDLQL
jgi:tRNA(fMet)-specific endonuclease VapC